MSPPKTPPPPSPLESAEQEALAHQLDKAGLLWSATANGGRRDKRTAAGLKRQGVKAGLPDVLIFSATPQAPRGAAVELKRQAPNKGRLSPAQVIWLDELTREGIAALVAYGAHHALDQLKELGYEVESIAPLTTARERPQDTATPQPPQRSPRDDTPPPSRHKHSGTAQRPTHQAPMRGERGPDR